MVNSNNVEAEVAIAVDKLQKSIDIFSGPLMKLGLFKTKAGEHLFIVIHQMIIDHMSWRIIFEDFTTAYLQLMHNQEIVWLAKTDSFRKWVEYLHEYANSEELLTEKPSGRRLKI